MDSPNPDLDRYVVEALVDHVSTHKEPTNYHDLAEAVGEIRGNPSNQRKLGDCLGRIQHYCENVGLPEISLMVERADGTLHESVTKYYREYHPEVDNLTDSELVDEVRKACVSCTDWQPLLYFVRSNSLGSTTQAEKTYEEGSRVTRVVSEEIKRSPKARADCLAKKGTGCIVCEKDLEAVYGVPGIIDVHHLEPLSESDGVREVDPIKDLVPVCPNCHAVIHSKKSKDGESSVYTPNEVRAMLGLPPLESYEQTLA